MEVAWTWTLPVFGDAYVVPAGPGAGRALDQLSQAVGGWPINLFCSIDQSKH